MSLGRPGIKKMMKQRMVPSASTMKAIFNQTSGVTSAAVITPPMIQLAVVLTRFPEVSSASVAERNAGRTLPSAHVQDAPAVDQSASLLHGATRVPTAGSDERWPKPVLRRGLT